jgi:hypothetical protein
MLNPDDACCVFSRGGLIDTMCLCEKYNGFRNRFHMLRHQLEASKQ